MTKFDFELDYSLEYGLIPVDVTSNQSEAKLLTTGQTWGRSEHHRKISVLISAEIRKHKLAEQTLFLA